MPLQHVWNDGSKKQVKREDFATSPRSWQQTHTEKAVTMLLSGNVPWIPLVALLMEHLRGRDF